MNVDLLDTLNSTLGGPAIRHVSGLLAESEDNTRMAVRAAGPTLLAALMQRIASPQGVGEIFRTITSDAVDSGVASKLSGVLANRGSTESLLNSGEMLTGVLFGPRTGTVTNALSEVSGVRPNSAMTILSVGAPLMLGMLKKLVANNDLDAASLASLITRQRGSLERAGLDDRIAGALGFSGTGALLASLPAVGARPPAKAQATGASDKSWMPWGIAAAVAALGVLFFVNRTSEQQEVPGGAVQIAEVPAESEPLRVASADSTRVYFESGDASIDAEDRQRIADMAQSARSSDRAVAITGYTDQTGDEAGNADLARDRATAVRDALLNEGLEEGRIVMDPPKVLTDEEAERVDIDMR